MNATDVIARAQGFVCHHGRPAWLDQQLLDELVAEATDRRSAATQIERQAHSEAGPRAQAFARSDRLVGLVAQAASRPPMGVRPSGNANFLYYDQPGAGIDPHMDSPDFPLQVLLMLEHEGYGERRSALVVFPDGPKDPVRVVLDPGELVVFRAASVFHGRSRVSPGERLTLLGIGYV
jgi:hypothetical protein